MSSRKYNIPKEYKERDIYSISRIGTFNGCEYEYYLNYILKLQGKNSIYGIIGGDTHEIIERLQKKELTNEQAINEFKNCLLKAKLLGLKFPSEKVEKNYTECILHFLKHYKPIDKKYELEKEIYNEILFFVFIGFIDILTFNDDGSVDIGDYKTSTKFTAKEFDEKGFQLILYGLLMEKIGYKVNRVYWNMLKYCTITWQGKTTARSRMAERNNWVNSILTELNKDLKEFSAIEKELLLNTAITNNDLDCMPEFIKNKYTISDCIIEYPYTEDKKDLFYMYISSVIPKIESKSKDESEWKPKEITEKNNFYCSVLCGQRYNCKYYKAFAQKLENNDDNKMDNISIFNIFS